MTFAWTEQLSTGIEEIDAQHKTRIGKFNDLIAACNQEKGREEVQKFLQFLTGYVVVHFSDEETLMRQRGYLGYDAHRLEHQQFRERLAKLRDDFVAGMQDQVVSESVWLAAEWFIGHIKRSDLVMAEHVRKGRQA